MTWKLLTCGPEGFLKFFGLVVAAALMAIAWWWKPFGGVFATLPILSLTCAMLDSDNKDCHIRAIAAGLTRPAVERALLTWRVIFAATLWLTALWTESIGPRPLTSLNDITADYFLAFGETPLALAVWLVWVFAFIVSVTKITYSKLLMGQPDRYSGESILHVVSLLAVLACPFIAPHMVLPNAVWLVAIATVALLQEFYTMRQCQRPERRKASHV